jgi:hypothetical protein
MKNLASSGETTEDAYATGHSIDELIRFHVFVLTLYVQHFLHAQKAHKLLFYWIISNYLTVILASLNMFLLKYYHTHLFNTSFCNFSFSRPPQTIILFPPYVPAIWPTRDTGSLFGYP